jgi:predicted glycosyltransferase
MRVLCHAQHLSGVGHFVRMHAIASGLAAAGYEVHLIDGGRPVPRASTLIRRLELPRLERVDGRLRGLDGAAGEATVGERAGLLAAAVERIRPHAVVVDHFPFSKWELEPEIAAAATAARRHGARVVCSLRDVVRQTAFEEVAPDAYAARVLALLGAHFDAVLVHADPSFVRLDDHFARAADLPVPLRYTGFVGEGARPADAALGEGPHAVLSCGGTDGTAFLRAAIAGFRLAAATGAPGAMRLLVFPDPRTATGGAAALGVEGDERVRVVGFTSAFGSWLAGSALSISRGGYNTTVDLLCARVRAVVVPDARMSDQGARARRLAQFGLAAVVEGDPPRAEAIAAAIGHALAAPRPRHRLDVGGVAATRTLLERLVTGSEGAWSSTATSASRSTRA